MYMSRDHTTDLLKKMSKKHYAVQKLESQQNTSHITSHLLQLCGDERVQRLLKVTNKLLEEKR